MLGETNFDLPSRGRLRALAWTTPPVIRLATLAG
jgi:hypothetical protein